MAFASYLFDGEDDYISHTWSSTATDAERRTFTLSMWGKANPGEINLGGQVLNESTNEQFAIQVGSSAGDIIVATGNPSGTRETASAPGGDINTWHHYVTRVDTTQANAADRMRLYFDGALLAEVSSESTLNEIMALFSSGTLIAFGAAPAASFFLDCRLAFIDVVSGQSLGPDAFAFDDDGIWTRKQYEGSYGNFGFSLDGSDGFNDVSGNGFHFTQSGGVQLDPNDLPPFLVGGGASIAPKMMHYRRLRI